MTVLEASKAVLEKSGRPMSGREIFEAIRAEGLWQPSGKTPVATIVARIYVDMRNPLSCFVKVAKGAFGGILHFFNRRRPCVKSSKWRVALEAAGVRFDAKDFVKDWRSARNPL